MVTIVYGALTSFINKSYIFFRRALKISEKYFISAIIKEQDILGTKERLQNFLLLIDSEIRAAFEEKMSPLDTSLDRWKAFVNCFDSLFQKVCTFLLKKYILQFFFCITATNT